MSSALAGKFIVLDGPEGCGKTTQAGMLRDRLVDGPAPLLGPEQVVLLRDPGTTRIGEQVRAILLDPAQADMAMRCEMLLYMSARAQMMSQTLLPALSAGKLVLCDRFVSSTLAYQLGGEGLTAEQIVAVAGVAIQDRWPDLTILLDIAPGRGLGRVRRPRDRIEQRPADYHERVRANYLAQARANPDRFRVVAADRDRSVVHEDIARIVLEVASSASAAGTAAT